MKCYHNGADLHYLKGMIPHDNMSKITYDSHSIRLHGACYFTSPLPSHLSIKQCRLSTLVFSKRTLACIITLLKLQSKGLLASLLLLTFEHVAASKAASP